LQFQILNSAISIYMASPFFNKLKENIRQEGEKIIKKQTNKSAPVKKSEVKSVSKSAHLTKTSLNNPELNQLIDLTLSDGVLTEKEKQVLFKKAQGLGVDLDEFEVVLDSKLNKIKNDAFEKKQAAAPKSNKYGDVKKCPNCGATVPQLTGICEECGYEFSNVGVTLYSQTLADKIEKIRKETAQKKFDLSKSGLYSASRKEGEICSPLEKAQMNIDSEEKCQIDSLVNTYPIPNTKGELYDLISFLRVEGYSEKLKESLKKALQLFPNDEMFLKIASDVEVQEKKSKRETIREKIIYGIISFIVIILAILAWWFGLLD